MWKNQQLISEQKYRIVFVGNTGYKTLFQINWNRQIVTRQLFLSLSFRNSFIGVAIRVTLSEINSCSYLTSNNGLRYKA